MDFISLGLSLAGFSDEGCLRQDFGITWTNNVPIKSKKLITNVLTLGGCGYVHCVSKITLVVA